MKKRTLCAVMCVCFSFTIVVSCPAATAAANEGACDYSSTALSGWATFLSRELRDHDPDHASQMSKVASAIIYGRIATVVVDLDAGLDPNSLLKLGAKPASYMSLLTLAAAACRNDIARRLVEAGASVNAADPPLAAAAAKGDVALAEFLIEKGASIDQVDPDGKSALYNAMAQSQPDMVKLLLEKGANSDVPLLRAYLERLSQSSKPSDRAMADVLRKYLHSAR